ncbi:histidine kinase [Clostridium sp. OS1-26]|uniref:histidine kinase n=1 Tax=Clostridium sp. OS1-26 TaxID=3070681 RepID=UPI0027E07BCC|nr:histidine kinase [Clostridium sp. OS1-26]WML32779.1 histidine kinase [Clostridium sp. OS1-26]
MIIIRILIVDDDQTTSLTLSNIAQDYDCVEILQCSYSKFISDNYWLDLRDIDILIITSPIPFDSRLIAEFNGKIIVISDVNDKKTIVQAYLSGAEYFITKPINQFEVMEIIKKSVELIKLEKYMYNIKKSLNLVET